MPPSKIEAQVDSIFERFLHEASEIVYREKVTPEDVAEVLNRRVSTDVGEGFLEWWHEGDDDG